MNNIYSSKMSLFSNLNSRHNLEKNQMTVIIWKMRFESKDQATSKILSLLSPSKKKSTRWNPTLPKSKNLTNWQTKSPMQARTIRENFSTKVLSKWWSYSKAALESRTRKVNLWSKDTRLTMKSWVIEMTELRIKFQKWRNRELSFKSKLWISKEN